MAGLEQSIRYNTRRTKHTELGTKQAAKNKGKKTRRRKHPKQNKQNKTYGTKHGDQIIQNKTEREREN